MVNSHKIKNKPGKQVYDCQTLAVTVESVDQHLSWKRNNGENNSQNSTFEGT
jgi:alkyl hydroperoxide reductase subunit AhpC